VSVALHAGLLAAFLILADRAGQGAHEALDATPMIELVMVEQKGRGPTTGQAPPLPGQAVKTAPSMPAPPTSAAATPQPAPPPSVLAPAAPPSALPPAVPATVAPSPTPPPAPHQPLPPAASSPPPPPPPPVANAPAAEAVVLPPPPAPATPPAPSPASSAAASSAPLAPSRSQMAEREAPPPRPSAVPAPAPANPMPPAPNADTNPHINLGGTDSLSNVLVEGDQVIPAGPDPKVHNREPIYPDEAVRRGEQGLVILRIQVSPEGLPDLVDIARSSGFTRLDSAARDAVVTWRFVPAVRDGQPIPSSMALRIQFLLD
jgi:protein TonB